jgi:hypothetical protein
VFICFPSHMPQGPGIGCALGEFVISKSKARPLALRLRRHCLVMNKYMLARLQSADDHCAHLRLIAHVQKSIRGFPHDCATLRLAAAGTVKAVISAAAVNRRVIGRCP